MNFTEAAAKPILAAHGISVPAGGTATTADEAAALAERLGPCVVKAQVPTGKRGKAGGIQLASSPAQAREHASRILAMSIGGYAVEQVLVEQQMPIASELYAAVLNDSQCKGPMLMFSATGGMDIEEIAARDPKALKRLALDIRRPIDCNDVMPLLSDIDDAALKRRIAEVLVKLYDGYRANDAELLEVNPLVVLKDGAVVALDCKFTLEDSAVKRRQELASNASPERLDALEKRGSEQGLKYISLDGEIGVLANGAGVTMTTMDVITHLGGSAANFLEIGGESYTKGTEALSLVLSNPKVKAMVVNFCGAFARTDVMTAGVLDAMDALSPKVPFFFCIHGTGAEEARAMLAERRGMSSYDTMDDAIAAAVAAAR